MQASLANIFQPLVNVFEAILKFFHDDIGLGWGLAIIALTVLIRSLLLPLTLKQLRSMYRMAQFTPEMRKLRDKHGSDPRRLQRETMAFYRENRINPLGSLLPAVAQLPVFLSVYFMLRTDLRHDICPGVNPPGTSNPQSCGETAASQFLFIPDLTSRATGAVLVALIALYVGSQLFSLLLSANPTMDKTQRMIFIALPFLFIAIAWQLRAEDRAEPPPSGRRPRTSGDSTTKIPTGSGPPRSKGGSRPTGHQRRASGPPPAPRRHKKKRSGRRR